MGIPQYFCSKDISEHDILCLRSSPAQVFVCCILRIKSAVQSTSATILYLDIDSFHFKSIGFDSAILQRAFDRQVSCQNTQCKIFLHGQHDYECLKYCKGSAIACPWLPRQTH